MSEPSSIEGLSFVDGKTLPDEFRSFRRESIYFISSISFYPDSPDGTASDPLGVQRVLTLTPMAFFITDVMLNMDRAIKFEAIRGAFWQRKKVEPKKGKKGLFSMGSTKPVDSVLILLKVPTEVDCLFRFDISDGMTESEEFLRILKTLVLHDRKVRQAKKVASVDSLLDDPPSQGTFEIVQLEAQDDINTRRSAEVASNYQPPAVVLKRNEEKKKMLEQLEIVSREALTLNKQVTDLRETVEKRQTELKLLESRYGVDLSSLRTQKEQLAKMQLTRHKQNTNMEIELVRLQADVSRCREQLDQEREHFDSLVTKRISKSNDDVFQQQQKMMTLRQKAQIREAAKANEQLSAIVSELAVEAAYSSDAALSQLTGRTKEAEDRVNEAVNGWCQEMYASNKLEKFLNAVNLEIAKVSQQISERNDEKNKVLQQRADRLKAFQKATAASMMLSDSNSDGNNSFGSTAANIAQSFATPPSAPRAMSSEAVGDDNANNSKSAFDDDLLGSSNKQSSTANPTVDPLEDL